MSETKPWPATNVEMRPIDALVPYARNARTHSDQQIDQLCASMREWGWTTPLLVDEQGTILAGHGRLMAARRLGLNEVPVMVARGWSEGQRRAYVIADNKLALNAGWDHDLLKLELDELVDLNFPIEMTGFSTEEWRTLFDDWESDIHAVDRLEPTDETAEAKATVTFREEDRGTIVEALERTIAELGLEHVSLKA